MLKSRKATTRATKTKKFRHSCRRHPTLLTSIATAAITINLLVVYPSCTQRLFVAAAVFVFAQGPQQLPPPPTSFIISMPPSPVLLARHYASRADGDRHQLQTALVRKLKNEGVIQHEKVMQVMQQVDRANYVSGSYSSYPYDDSPQSIACGQTISAPHMHGYALEYIRSALERPSPPRGEAEHEGAGSSDASSGAVVQQQEEEPTIATKVLDVGCGSGYLTAALGRWVHPHDGTSEPRILSKQGKVYGMDIYPELVEMTRSNLQKEDGDLLESGTVMLKVGNGWEGWPDAAPFDAIHVGAAADDFPNKLANQLRVGGVMIVPIGPTYGMQYLYKVERVAQTGNAKKDFETHRLLGVRYVPLVHQRPSA